MDTTEEGVLNIYTDGSSYSNPRKGGVGYSFVYIDENGNEQSIGSSAQGYSGASNNQMELQACVMALEDCLSRRPSIDVSAFRSIEIYTDSMYVRDGYRQALYVWSKNGWYLRTGAPVQNAELWKKLVRLTQKMYREKRLRVSINWVKGHKSSQYNKEVDKLAKQSAKNAQKQQIAISDVRRKITKKKTDIGSVVPQGQRLTIRIIEDKLLRVQKCYWYRYEVISKQSEFYGNVDIATSDISLAAGHKYSVRLNSIVKNPRIEKLFKEVN
jgi:ribonuclease HI